MKAFEHYCYSEQEAMRLAQELRSEGRYRKVKRWMDREGTHIVTAWV